MWVLVLQRITLEFFWNLIYFPVWWYTAGAKRAFLACGHFFLSVNSYLAPGLWLKNVFVPMYGQRDWQGRLISIFIRLANVVIRSIGLFIWFILIVILFFVWLLFPVLVLSMIFNTF